MDFTLLIDDVAKHVNINARILQQRKSVLVDNRPVSFSLVGDPL